MGLFRSSMRDKYERKYSDKDLFKRFTKRLVPFKKNIVLIASFMVLQAITAVIAPLLVGFVTDEIILGNPRYVLTMVAAVGFLFLYLGNWQVCTLFP